MLTRTSRNWFAFIGVLGVIMQGFSFSINPGPPAGLTADQIIAWGHQNANLVLVGAWTQGVSSFLIVLFVLGLVYQAGQMNKPLGWITLLASAVIVSISIIESTYYLGATYSGIAGNVEGLLMNLSLIQAIQHAYVIAPATAFLVSISLVILTTRVLPVAYSYIGFLIGGVLEIIGFIALFTPLQSVVDNVLIVQELWLLVCAITFWVWQSAPQRMAQTVAS